jgi:hypothetical protein
VIYYTYQKDNYWLSDSVLLYLAFFDKIFVKKDDYYIPKTNNEKLLLKEDLFKNLYKKKEKKQKSEPKENIELKIENC